MCYCEKRNFAVHIAHASTAHDKVCLWSKPVACTVATFHPKGIKLTA
jgi:hypothetical protein